MANTSHTQVALANSALQESNRIYKKRSIVNTVMLCISVITLLFGLFWLAWILFTLIQKGGAGLSLQLFTESTPAPGDEGGLINAIVGSLMLSGVGTIIGTPIGILAGTYLAEYGKTGWLAPATRFLNDILLSAPSIIIGLFIYTLYVLPSGHASGWAGSLALAILVIPVVTRKTDNMLELISNHMREAAYALGCPKWKMIMSICYKAAMSGIITGVMLAIARILGETAPLLFTAVNSPYLSYDMNDQMANLPVAIYNLANSPYKDLITLAWAGAIFITALVLILNILARVITRQK